MFYNSVFKDDVRFKPCKNWCEAQKPELETPPSVVFFNNQLGINPTPFPETPVFKADLKQLQALSNNSTSTGNTQTDTAVAPTSNIHVASDKIELSTTTPNSTIIKNSNSSPTNNSNTQSLSKAKKIGIGVGILALLVGGGVALSN